MSLAGGSDLPPHTRSPAFEESIVTATYTFDVFCSLDGYGSYLAFQRCARTPGPAVLDWALVMRTRVGVSRRLPAQVIGVCARQQSSTQNGPNPLRRCRSPTPSIAFLDLVLESLNEIAFEWARVGIRHIGPVAYIERRQVPSRIMVTTVFPRPRA